MNLHSFKLPSILLNFIFCQILAKLSGVESKMTISMLRKRKFLCSVHLLHKVGHEIRKFHVNGSLVQRWLRHVHKHDACAEFLLSLYKPIAFLPFLLPSPLVKPPVVVIQKFCYHDGNMMSQFSSLLT